MVNKSRREIDLDDSSDESEHSSQSEEEIVVVPKLKTKKKKPNPKKGKQLSIFGVGIEKIDPATQLNGSMTLLTDEIYRKKVPARYKVSGM